MTKAQREKFKRHIRVELKHTRELKGLSQEDIAKSLRVTQQLVDSWEAGRKTIPMDRYVAYCRAVGISPGVTVTAAEARAGG
jgi:transcriptional regulator with XRE-family HTH domain